jgi:phosphopantetheinyl transferase (holo-ACP synthase)
MTPTPAQPAALINDPESWGSVVRNFVGIIERNCGCGECCKVENIEDQFNSWQSKMLMVHIEELQNENYQNHHFESTVKQLAAKESSSRAMHCETTQSTNQGLIRTDEATIQRSVILHSKPAELYWNQKTKELSINYPQEELEANVGFSL